MAEIPVEKKFQILCDITRATFFTWRKVAEKLRPDIAPLELVNMFWEETAHDTAGAYLRRLKADEPELAKAVAESIVWSSVTMGEDAKAVPGDKPGEWFVRHDACPWYGWHQRLGLLHEDQPGCDKWFEVTIKDINEKLKTNVKFETQSSLPAGEKCCLRRIWVE